MGELRKLSLKSHHFGQFGGYAVYGFEYQSEDGQVGWHTMSLPNENPVHDYWVTNGEIHVLSIHFDYNHTSETRIETFGVAKNVAPDEKKAIFEAIAQWDAESRENPSD